MSIRDLVLIFTLQEEKATKSSKLTTVDFTRKKRSMLLKKVTGMRGKQNSVMLPIIMPTMETDITIMKIEHTITKEEMQTGILLVLVTNTIVGQKIPPIRITSLI